MNCGEHVLSGWDVANNLFTWQFAVVAFAASLLLWTLHQASRL